MIWVRPASRAPALLTLLAFSLALPGCSALRYFFRTSAPGRVLIADLAAASPEAGPDLCDPRAARSRVRLLSESGDGAMADVVYGLLHTQVSPKVWRRCAALLLTGLPEERARALLSEMGRGYKALLKTPGLERERDRRERLIALHQTFLERPIGTAPDPVVLEQLTKDLKRAMQERRLGPIATRYAEDLLENIEQVEKGRFQGEAVTDDTMDRLPRRSREALLRRFARRLPDPELRVAARRRLLAIQVAASPYPEVRKTPEGLFETVLRLGHNPVSLEVYPPVRAFLEGAKLPVRGLAVRQHIADRKATLLLDREGEPGALPVVPLRGALQLELQGMSHRVKLCAPPRLDDIDLDPSPCVLASELRSLHPLIQIDKDGNCTFKGDLASQEVLELATQGAGLRLSLKVGPSVLPAVEWPLRYLPPSEEERRLFQFGGRGPEGAPGPAVQVDVNHEVADRLAFIVRSEGASYFAVVPLRDLGGFVISTSGSPGPKGAPGPAGSAGAPGYAGQDAICAGPLLQPSAATDGGPGQPGGQGGQGGQGGPGGDGGDISVRVFCKRSCPETSRLLLDRGVLRSIGAPGGPGGPGGSGGRGGRGGRGGNGAVCTVQGQNGQVYRFQIPAGREGPPGQDGPEGPEGGQGPAGQPGRIEFTLQQ